MIKMLAHIVVNIGLIFVLINVLFFIGSIIIDLIEVFPGF